MGFEPTTPSLRDWCSTTELKRPFPESCLACFVNSDRFLSDRGRGSVAEWSKALVLGTSLSGRGFESHRCHEHTFFLRRTQLREQYSIPSQVRQDVARWSRGMIRASGARGPGFNSRTSPLSFFCSSKFVETLRIQPGAWEGKRSPPRPGIEPGPST